MKNNIKIVDNELVIKLGGFSKITKNNFTIPINNIDGATIDKGIVSDNKGIRNPGINFKGLINGTFVKNGQKSFWNVSKKDIPIVIRLHNEKYDQLILGIDNTKIVDEINNLV
ncbi:hypothetical protein DY124_06690 [Apilactobacillus micheneri]|uniref:hypothetical protein n=1 Tax=Apilactobacillus micheneri TaxID=1899430 RepID=UPI0011285B61|nr:hypothetical protein [Apilactobacillus micheneri]TPR42961.1 hypothetical protein DY124_06690 [Apilactobacillus micheneri]TPR47293.1 hypothetical protein DY125_06375 [Apilactobacillus micheneri]